MTPIPFSLLSELGRADFIHFNTTKGKAILKVSFVSDKEFGVDIVEQRVKLLALMLTLYIAAVQVPAVLLLVQFPVIGPGKAAGDDQSV